MRSCRHGGDADVTGAGSVKAGSKGAGLGGIRKDFGAVV